MSFLLPRFGTALNPLLFSQVTRQIPSFGFALPTVGLGKRRRRRQAIRQRPRKRKQRGRNPTYVLP